MKEDYINQINDSFVEFSQKTNERFPAKLKTIRNNAQNSFNSIGFPTKKNEEWKYADTSFIFNNDFKFPTEDEINYKGITDIKEFLINGKKDNIVVLINGRFSKELSRINTESERIKIGSLADAMVYKAATIEKHFAQYANFEKDPFVALNTMFATDGCYIRANEGVILEHPIHIIYINTAFNNAPIIQPRNLIIVGECSQLKIYETYHTIGDKPVFQNAVTEIFLKRFANIEHYKVQNNNNSYYIDSTQVQQKRTSIYTNNTITLKGAFNRNTLGAYLDEELCQTNLYGMYFIGQKDFVDNHSRIDHAKPNCTSNELYKGIIDNEATAVFNGKIYVWKDAQQTSAYQSNKNILMSNDATINSKPQLEIFADDVKCSHGATCGNLDKEQLYYLLSRGISEKKAKALLLNAFASEIVEKISIAELRDYVKRLVAERFAEEDIYFCDNL